MKDHQDEQRVDADVGDPTADPVQDAGLGAILSAVRSATRHDFQCYKRATLERRIRRRMGLRHLGDYDEYARLLQADSDEAVALRQDLLIGITEFFRQPEAWRILDEKVIAGLVENAPAESAVRAWVPACATGKEAYSLAMLLFEHIERSGRRLAIQIFATDADATAIETARIGRYDEPEMGGVSPDRIARFFVRKEGRYEVAKHLRELVVFAPHDLTSDPPFSRVDLISCRNLFIYLDSPLQQRITRVFHFALREGGSLFLGSAESIGGQEHLFQPLSRKWRIFRKLPATGFVALDMPTRRADRDGLAPFPPASGPKETLSVLAHQAIADRFGPASAVVDRRGTVLYLHGDVEPFLQMPSGAQTGQLQDAAREGLRNPLVPALLRATDENETVSVLARMRRNGKSVPVKVTVAPLRQTREAEGLLLVTFEEQRVARPARPAAEGDPPHADNRRIEEELRLTQEELSGTIEQLRHSNEYLRASNEEVTSANEELQSINEELETSREELQSLNEEMNAVNLRLQENVTELEEVTWALRASEAQALWLARFPDENPNPVARVSADGTVLYRNPAAARHPGWVCEVGEALPQASLRHLVSRSLAEGRTLEQDLDLGGANWAVAVAPIPAEGYANLYGRDVTERRKAQEALKESELRVRRKLQSVLSPEGDLGSLDLADLIDAPSLQKLMDDFHAVAGIPMSVVDVRGRLLVGVGWQDICTRFHRVHPETSQHCLESDTLLASGLAQGESRLYKCRNNLWDMATPIVVGDRHVGNIFTGQFFFDDETVDREAFRTQARRYGLDEADYLAALDRVPRLDRRDVERGMGFFLKLADMLSQLGYSNVKLARLLEERDRLTGSLREGEDRLKRAQDIAHLGSWELDLLTNELTWSDEVYRIFGLAPQEFGATYGAFLERVHPEDRVAVDAAYSDSLREGRDTYEIEHRVVRSGTGEVRFVHEKCEHLRDATGRIVRSVGMVHDITDRKQAEEALRDSEERLRLFIEHAPAALAMFDRQMRYLSVSQRWLSDFGLDGRDLSGLSHYDVFPEINAHWRQIHRQALAGEVLQADEDRFVRADGTVQWLRWEVRPWRDASGNVAGIVIFSEDITGRKRSEQEFREALAKAEEGDRLLSALMEYVPEGIAIADASGRLRMVSRHGQEYLGAAHTGMSVDEVLAHRTARLPGSTTPMTSSDLPLVRTLQTGQPVYDAEMVQTDAQGRMFHLLGNAAPIRDAEGNVTGAIVAWRDVTDRKHAEEALRRSREDLEERVAERTREVEALADRLRALATELTQAEQRERLRLAKTLHDHLQQLLVAAQMQLSLIPRADANAIQATARSVDAIIKEALVASRSLTVELCPPVLHQSGLVAALSWLATSVEDKQQFKVHLRATNDAEPASPEVRAFLFEAVRELLLNAVKHSSVREAHLAMLRTRDDQCRIVLEDEGRGFDPAALRPGTSGGFGLFSIQQRLLHLGGSLELESAPGRGTKAVLTIPIGRPAEVAPSSLAPPGGTSGQVRVQEKGPKIGVLLVDDHQIMRQGLTSLLQFESDVEIVGEAENGEQAVALARLHRPDVVIMDVNMPVMDGVTATRLLTTEIPGIKVIGLSMHLDHDAANAMREAGAVAYITKGGHSEDLVAAIRACGASGPERSDAHP